jgi:hypothetical protein
LILENLLIKHIVMWNLRGETPAEKRDGIAQLQRSFESLRGRIPGLLHIEIGVDSSRIDYACDVVLYSEFESQTALDGYAVHPEHLRVKQELADLRTARHQVDYTSAPVFDIGTDTPRHRHPNLENGDMNER